MSYMSISSGLKSTWVAGHIVSRPLHSMIKDRSAFDKCIFTIFLNGTVGAFINQIFINALYLYYYIYGRLRCYLF